MKSNTKHNRDPLTFSLRGARWVNSHAMLSVIADDGAMLPVIADDGINRSWEARLRRRPAPAPCCEESAPTRQIEALLARYFAHGCCSAA